MKLESIAKCTIGPNSIEKKRLTESRKIYSVEDMQRDLYLGKTNTSSKYFKSKFVLNAGDIIINLMTNCTSIVSLDNEGKVMTQAMMKVEPNSKVDSWYLCFLLNESQFVKKQEKTKMEGTVIKRVTAKLIKDLNIQLPSLEKQKLIGKGYRLALRNKNLLLDKANYIFDSSINILQKYDINDEKL